MNNDATPARIIAFLITVLVAFFGASARCVRRVRGLRGPVRGAFVRVLQGFAARGYALAYVGEDDATVEKRIARMEWIARDPVKALRHLMRLARGFMRARLGGAFAPPEGAPVAVGCGLLAAGADALTLEPDT